GHAPLASLLVGAQHHLLADLDQVERHQDLVDGDQLGAVLAVEGSLALLRRKGVAPVRGFLAPVGPDGVRAEQPDALEADERRVLGDDAVPVPEPPSPAGVVAGAGGVGRGLVTDHPRDPLVARAVSLRQLLTTHRPTRAPGHAGIASTRAGRRAVAILLG